MIMVKSEDVLLRNNSGAKSEATLIDGFVIRHTEFNRILYGIKQSFNDKSVRHYLVIGHRGSGKTTLLHRLNYEIRGDENLRRTFLPIIFSEEQYNLSDLTTLWEAIAMHLEDTYNLKNLTNEIARLIEEGDDYQFAAYHFLESEIKKSNKIIILFIENFNVYLNKLSDEEREQLMDVLVNSNFLMIIASSTVIEDNRFNFSDDAFSHLELVTLSPIDKAECEKLLVKIGEQYGEKEQIEIIIKNHPGRIEALRRLTGGVPRTISYLFQIFMDNENGKALRDLYYLIDSLSPLYKAELDQLSPQQQKVVDAVARKWDAIGVKEVVKQTRLESKNISNIIRSLERNMIIEKVPTNTKNHLYRIRERFMNVWYLMRFGRKNDKDNVIWLVRFFDAWCDEAELTNRIKAHINNLKGGGYDVNAAIDMGNTFLSCENVSEILKLELITITNSIIPERMRRKARLSGGLIQDTIVDLAKSGKYNEAVEALVQIETRDKDYYILSSYVYLLQGNYTKAKEAAESVLEFDNEDAKAYFSLGIIYEHMEEISKAQKYFELSLAQKPPHPYAASRLGDIAFKYDNDIGNAEKYHRQAIAKNVKSSLLALGKIFYISKRFEEAETILKDAVEANVKGSYSELAKVYDALQKPKEAKETFQKAVKANEEDALINFGVWYLKRKKPNNGKAKILFQKAIEGGDMSGYAFLGKLLRREGNIDEAISVLREGTAAGDAESSHNLGHIYASREEFDSSDEMFLNAIKLGDYSAVLCLAMGIFNYGRVDKKHFALQVLENNLPKLNKDAAVEIIHSTILLWNDEVEQSVMVLKNSYQYFLEIVKKNEKRQEMNDGLNSSLNQMFNYFLLLLAKKEYRVALNLFEDTSELELKIMLKPIYYFLMGELKQDFPLEYLKAGDELKDTLIEIKNKVEELRNVI